MGRVREVRTVVDWKRTTSVGGREGILVLAERSFFLHFSTQLARYLALVVGFLFSCVAVWMYLNRLKINSRQQQVYDTVRVTVRNAWWSPYDTIMGI